MENVKDEDKVIKHMTEKMMMKFDKYWSYIVFFFF